MANHSFSAARLLARDLLAFLLGLCLPVVAVAVAYDALVGFRSDYLGHFLAGYGATLFVTICALWAIGAERFDRLAPAAIVLLVVAAIGAGAVLEATVYRLGKFDEVDFCNQSLGAVMAGLGLLAMFRAPTPTARPSSVALAASLCFAALLVRAGYYYAFL